MRFLAVLLATSLLTACNHANDGRSHEGRRLGQGETPIAVHLVSGDCDRPPVFVQGKAPAFPRVLKDDGIYTGTITVTYTVTKDGRARGLLVKSASIPQLAAGVVEVMPTWRFTPAQRQGAPVEVVVESSFEFAAEYM